jgi:hypothetical protein
MFYNFVRIQQMLRLTPARAAGVTDRVWQVSDIVKLLEDKPEEPNYQDEAHYGPALGSDPQHTPRQASVLLKRSGLIESISNVLCERVKVLKPSLNSFAQAQFSLYWNCTSHLDFCWGLNT